SALDNSLIWWEQLSALGVHRRNGPCFPSTVSGCEFRVGGLDPLARVGTRRGGKAGQDQDKGGPDDVCTSIHEHASTISSGEYPPRRDSGPVRGELSMLRSLALSELASEADLGKLLQPTQMAHRRRRLPNIGAARADDARPIGVSAMTSF